MTTTQEGTAVNARLVRDVRIEGWSVQFEAPVARRINAGVEYAVADAEWERRSYAWTLRRVAPSVLRRESERLHDVHERVPPILAIQLARTWSHSNCSFWRILSARRTSAT